MKVTDWFVSSRPRPRSRREKGREHLRLFQFLHQPSFCLSMAFSDEFQICTFPARASSGEVFSTAGRLSVHVLESSLCNIFSVYWLYKCLWWDLSFSASRWVLETFTGWESKVGLYVNEIPKGNDSSARWEWKSFSTITYLMLLQTFVLISGGSLLQLSPSSHFLISETFAQ